MDSGTKELATFFAQLASADLKALRGAEREALRLKSISVAHRLLSRRAEDRAYYASPKGKRDIEAMAREWSRRDQQNLAGLQAVVNIFFSAIFSEEATIQFRPLEHQRMIFLRLNPKTQRMEDITDEREPPAKDRRWERNRVLISGFMDLFYTRPRFPFMPCRRCKRIFVRRSRQVFCSAECRVIATRVARKESQRAYKKVYMRTYMAARRAAQRQEKPATPKPAR